MGNYADENGSPKFLRSHCKSIRDIFLSSLSFFLRITFSPIPLLRNQNLALECYFNIRDRTFFSIIPNSYQGMQSAWHPSPQRISPDTLEKWWKQSVFLSASSSCIICLRKLPHCLTECWLWSSQPSCMLNSFLVSSHFNECTSHISYYFRISSI